MRAYHRSLRLRLAADNHAWDAITYVVMSYSGPTVRSLPEIAQEITQPLRDNVQDPPLNTRGN